MKPENNEQPVKHHDLTEDEARAWLGSSFACACLGAEPDAPIQPSGERLCRCVQRTVDARYALGEKRPNG